jgi:nitrate/nitrite transporter NarK
MVTSFGFSGIHAFYPNMSKFLQQKFNFSNEEAGNTAALPYLVASFATPIFGKVVQTIGQTRFEKLVLLALILMMTVHFSFLTIDAENSTEFQINGLILMFGMSHALFSTLQTPIT